MEQRDAVVALARHRKELAEQLGKRLSAHRGEHVEMQMASFLDLFAEGRHIATLSYELVEPRRAEQAALVMAAALSPDAVWCTNDSYASTDYELNRRRMRGEVGSYADEFARGNPAVTEAVMLWGVNRDLDFATETLPYTVTDHAVGWAEEFPRDGKMEFKGVQREHADLLFSTDVDGMLDIVPLGDILRSGRTIGEARGIRNVMVGQIGHLSGVNVALRPRDADELKLTRRGLGMLDGYAGSGLVVFAAGDINPGMREEYSELVGAGLGG